ncbi:uncharacterized protein BDW43DRAFT_108839 [Aspergillus alliaceus]|uniref:uncharacterized protein n=1 Tax=Petromyces alliaceus TaxID=209559 RepID=UPI0012A3B394|nr:uncharacterized protein BDW43DRAFT_108839 [Aspergillus alliaceus]KAB8232412.1 hypothetical protein BDW43DRAFT_108839 [Aspergillus alliaceus]
MLDLEDSTPLESNDTPSPWLGIFMLTSRYFSLAFYSYRKTGFFSCNNHCINIIFISSTKVVLITNTSVLTVTSKSPILEKYIYILASYCMHRRHPWIYRQQNCGNTKLSHCHGPSEQE